MPKSCKLRGQSWTPIWGQDTTPVDSNDLREGSGVLYRYDPDGNWEVMDNGFTLVNGLDWSPDRRTLYVTDSRAPAIHAYDHDPASGAIGDRRPFVTFGPTDGFPDGLLVMPNGAMWSTMFGAGAVQEISPDGQLIRRVFLPASRPTSCCLSPGGDALFVTTARLGLDNATLDREPMAGALLRIPLGKLPEAGELTAVREGAVHGE